MNIKIVADSSSNILTFDGVSFASAPLKINAGDKEFVDDQNLDVRNMVDALEAHKGKSTTACPSVNDWMESFGNADIVYGVTITSALSGSYNSAQVAAEQYMQENPGKKVFIVDSLSTGPEMELIIEKFKELILKGLSFEEVKEKVTQYTKKTCLLFSLASLSNLAKNGRVHPALAAAVGLLGISVIGRADEEGKLDSMHKTRGEKRALSRLFACMNEMGFKGGKVRVSHCFNESMAKKLADAIRLIHPACDILINQTRGLCSFYAERNGILVGFEV